MFQGSPNEVIRNRLPVGFDADRARRDPDHPRPPRPLRLPAGGRPRGLHRSDLPDERDRRAGPDRPARQRAAPGGVREAPLPLGATSPRQGRGGRREGEAGLPRRARGGAAGRGRGPRPDLDRARPAIGRLRRGRGARLGSGARHARPGGGAARAAARARDRPRRRRSTPRPTPRPCRPGSARSGTARRSRSRRGSRATFVGRGPHPRLRDHRAPGPRVGRRRRRPRSSSRATSAGPGTPIISDPTPMSEADYVIVESTYGGREHEPGDEAVRMLAEVVRAVDDAGGVLLIPSFAIGRTQEIVWELDRLIERGEIPELPLYLDSPMALARLRRLPAPSRVLRRGDPRAPRSRATRPLDYPNQTITRTAAESKAIATAPPAVHDHRVERDAHRRTRRRPPAQPHRRPGRDRPVRRLPGRGHARRAPPGRREDGEDRRRRSARCSAASARSAASRRTPTSPSCWTGCATSGAGASPGRPATLARCSSSTATPTRSSPSRPKVEALGFRVHIPRWREQVELGGTGRRPSRARSSDRAARGGSARSSEAGRRLALTSALTRLPEEAFP